MDVVLYLRYSSDKQNEQSIEGQDRICTEYCIKNGHNIVRKYIDRATSASKNVDKRLEFQQMIHDAEKKQDFQAIVVYKLDRFARKRFDSAVYKNKLAKVGVDVISATENISKEPEGILLESVLEGLAEFYSKELAQKVTRGMRESAFKCHSTGGRVPFGYKIENKRYVADPEKAPILKEIFTRVANGEPKVSVIRDLNDRGIKTSKGTVFTKSSLQTILQNKKYYGVYKYDDIEIEGGMDALVSKELFDAVQKTIVSSPHYMQGKNVKYYLARKVYCGKCGERMNGESAYNKVGNPYYYYTCKNKKLNHTCDNSINKELLEETVFQALRDAIDDDYIAKICDAVVKENDRINNMYNYNGLTEQLNEVSKKIDNLLDLIEAGKSSPNLIERFDKLCVEQKSLQDQIEKSKDIIVLTREQVQFYLEKFFDNYEDEEDFKQQLFYMIVNRVIVYDEYVDVMLNLSEDCSRINPRTIPILEEDRNKNGWSCSTVESDGSPYRILSNTSDNLTEIYLTTFGIVRKKRLLM